MENVANLLSGPSEKRGGWFGRILGDLAECGYDAEWENIPASALGAPHRRERVWLVAHPAQVRNASQFFLKDCAKGYACWKSGASLLPAYNARMEPRNGDFTLRNSDGFSEFLGQLNGYGNAVVPQIPEMIGRAILAAEKETA